MPTGYCTYYLFVHSLHIFLDEFSRFDILSLRAKEATGVVMRLVGKFNNWFKDTFSAEKPRASFQEQCARYYTTCLLISCGLPPASPGEISESAIKRSFTLASELNREFDAFLDKFNPTSDKEQWKNQVMDY